MTDPNEWAESDKVREDEPAPTEGGTAGFTPTYSDDPQVLLEVDDVTLRFGGVVALDQIGFSIKRGEIFGLIGPNGAGKTTCFNAMTGVYRPTSGQIRFHGRELSDGASHGTVVTGKKKHQI